MGDYAIDLGFMFFKGNYRPFGTALFKFLDDSKNGLPCVGENKLLFDDFCLCFGELFFLVGDLLLTRLKILLISTFSIFKSSYISSCYSGRFPSSRAKIGIAISRFGTSCCDYYFRIILFEEIARNLSLCMGVFVDFKFVWESALIFN